MIFQPKRSVSMEFITYEMFGAVGDGVADDMPAIKAAHEEANRKNLPVKAKEGATYYISPQVCVAVVQTSVDWTGANFIIDDRQCENYEKPCFEVLGKEKPVELPLSTLKQGQMYIDNPTGMDLYVLVRNDHHRDYIRKGLNQNNGTARRDNFPLFADGSLPSPVAFDFDEITGVFAIPLPEDTLTITGGTFTTIANQAESAYNYHDRNISIRRSRVQVSNITHLITGELDHGAPYAGFITVSGCAYVTVENCLFTGHKIYQTIGAAGKPVSMGSYDISLGNASSVLLRQCSQTTDIHDRGYWGLIGSNFCRDMLLEDCHFSRFDAHQGVTNCTLRRCQLGWQCLNAIGYGTFVVEKVEAYGNALVNLRDDYGSTWHGDMVIRDCIWHPLWSNRSIFAGHNDGTHDFGYQCYLPTNITIDGLTVVEDFAKEGTPGLEVPLTICNDYLWTREETGEKRFVPIPPVSVKVKNIHTERKVELCVRPEIMPDTVFLAE